MDLGDAAKRKCRRQPLFYSDRKRLGPSINPQTRNKRDDRLRKVERVELRHARCCVIQRHLTPIVRPEGSPVWGRPWVVCVKPARVDMPAPKYTAVMCTVKAEHTSTDHAGARQCSERAVSARNCRTRSISLRPRGASEPHRFTVGRGEAICPAPTSVHIVLTLPAASEASLRWHDRSLAGRLR